MALQAGVYSPRKFVVIGLANLLRQRPDAIAFLEGILAPGRAGQATLHVKDGQMLAWSFQPAGRRKERN